MSWFWNAKANPEGAKIVAKDMQKAYMLANYLAGSYKPTTKLGRKMQEVAKYGTKRLMDSKRSAKRKAPTVYREGVIRTKQQTAKKRRRTRRKVSLKKKVNRLIKNAPKSSVVDYQYQERVKLPKAGGPMRSRFFEVVMLDKNIAQLAISNLSGVDYTTLDSNVLFKNMFWEFHITNGVTCNVELEYFWVQCKDSGGSSYLNDLDLEMTQRGTPLTSSVSSYSPDNYTTPPYHSKYPRRITLFPDERYTPITTGLNYANSHWRQLTQVQKCRLGPGDDIKIQFSKSSMAYKDELADQTSGLTYVKGLDTHLIIKTSGMFAHDETYPNVVTAFDTAQDCVKRLQFKIVYSDGKGLRVTNRDSEFTNQTVVSNPVQAEDKVSAMEPADE